MSDKTCRLEFKTSRETKEHLERLRLEFRQNNSESVSMASLLNTIVKSYLERLPVQEEEKK